MTERDFFSTVSNGQDDVPQMLLDMLAESGVPYCVIGGLAVNAYTEPVVSLALDIVIAVDGVERLCELAAGKGLKIERFEHSINLASPRSDLRVQIQTDERYQAFIAARRARICNEHRRAGRRYSGQDLGRIRPATTRKQTAKRLGRHSPINRNESQSGETTPGRLEGAVGVMHQ